MAIVYLEDKKIYVQNADKFLYEINSMEVYDGYDSLRYYLELIAGWNKESEEYCSPSECDEEVQEETIIIYPIQESLKGYFDGCGYEIVSKERAESIINNL